MGVEILSMKLDFLGGFSLASRLELTTWTSRCILSQRSMLQQLYTCLTTKRQRFGSHRLSSCTKTLLCSSLGAAEDLLEARLDRPREVPFRPCLESHVSAPPRSPLCAPDRPSLVGCHVR